ncbi:copper homeostasis membrane protein CopD [Croceicoccus ponticola]|nr:copper homeostasis membrane protein CopD [Croceicoccus ponticola]
MTDTAAIVARFALLLLSLGLAGLPLYLRLAGQRSISRGLGLALGIGSVLAALASVWWAAATVAGMAAMPIADLDWPTLQAVLAATPLGSVLAVRLAGLAAFVVALIVAPRTDLLAGIAALVLISGAWTGHAGAAEGDLGTFQRLSDGLHLLAAAIWFGALIVFLASLGGRIDTRPIIHRLERFARTGTIIVLVLVVTGTANAILIARSGWEPMSGWSLMLAAKIALFAAMLGFAGLNRWKLTPELAAQLPGAEGRLRTSLILETGSAIAIFGLVAALGLRDPAGL